jgi:hypothetical protein
LVRRFGPTKDRVRVLWDHSAFEQQPVQGIAGSSSGPRQKVVAQIIAVGERLVVAERSGDPVLDEVL